MQHPSSTALPGDPRFFSSAGPFTIQEIARQCGLDLPAGQCERTERRITGVAPLQAATENEISFLDNRQYLPLLEKTKAGAVVVSSAFADRVPASTLALFSPSPYVSWAHVASLFYPQVPQAPGIHESAVIDPSACIGRDVEIGPFVHVGRDVEIGDGTLIGSFADIGGGVQIGASCRIGCHVSLSHSIIGDGVKIYPGARLGQDGFGFAVGADGFVSVPQLGRVIVDSGVEIGANVTIDRGSMRDTRIGAGTRIDNLVQIGHNVQMGRCCIVVAQAGISGSTTLGDFVTIAAQAGLIGHIQIGEKARIGAQAGVISDVAAKADVIGSPAMPFREFFRNVATLRRLSKRRVETQSGSGQE